MDAISIVIVNWNSGALLGRCLDSIRSYASGVETIVVDNGSDDGSLDAASLSPINARTIGHSSNLGFAAGCNAGWRDARGGLVLFLNPDAECTPGAVRALAELFEGNEAIWAAGGMLMHPNGTPQAGFNVRRLPTPASAAAELLLLEKAWPRNRWAGWSKAPGYPFEKVTEVEQPAGACLMVRRSTLTRLDGFDARFFPAWFEDVDLCRRIRDAGGRILFHPGARFLHHRGSSLKRLGPEEFIRAFRTNQVRYFRKHFGPGVAGRIRRLVVAGMLLRAFVSLVHPILPGESRAGCFVIFRSCSRHFAKLSLELL